MNIELWVFLLAGLITGLITGIAGASSIVAFVPIILLFFDYDIFSLIGISLAVDVFVSLVAILIYRKYHHIDFKLSLYLLVFAIAGAIVGSYISFEFLPNSSLLSITGLISAFTGIWIFKRKIHTESYKSPIEVNLSFKKPLVWIAIVLAFLIGLAGGSLGAAGGISLLVLFVFLFGFETHRAVGTSIFIMFFIALAGSITHFYFKDFSWVLLLFAILGGVIGAVFSSRIANIINEKTLNKVVGIILFLLGISIFLIRIL